MRIKVLFSLLAIVGLLTVIPVAALAEGLRVDAAVFQQKVYVAGEEESPMGGRLSVSADLAEKIVGSVTLEVAAANGETEPNFGDLTTLGNYLETRAGLTYRLKTFPSGGSAIETSAYAWGQFASALDKSPEPAANYPKSAGLGLSFREVTTGASASVTYCRYEPTRPNFGNGQLCVSGEIPLGPVIFGGDFYLDLAGGAEARDLGRLRVGVSVPDLVKAIF